jgi:hypothetical protein
MSTSLESSAGTSNQIQQVLLCSWGAPAKRGSLICCNGLLVMQSAALASGVAGLFAGTLVRVAAQTSIRKKAAKAEKAEPRGILKIRHETMNAMITP